VVFFSLLSPCTVSVAKEPKFRPKNPRKTTNKFEGPEKLAAEFLSVLQKRTEKGPNFFKTLVSGIIYGSSEMKVFLSKLYLHLQFISFQLIFFVPETSFHVRSNFLA
jgi:hypothetical protein